VTINVIDTTDFPTAGSAAIISVNPASSFFAGSGSPSPSYVAYVRYTGKTATTLTGVSGFHSYGATMDETIPSGSAVIPFTACTPSLSEYAGDSDPWSDSSSSAWFGLFGSYIWRSAGGSAIAIDLNSGVADSFTYSLGSSASPNFYPGFSGVSGLASWTGTKKIIYETTGFATTVIASSGDKTTLTTNTSNNEYIKATGGSLLLASTTVGGYISVRYLSYSGTTITLEKSTYLDAATYTIIPLFHRTALNAALTLYSISNAATLCFSESFISSGQSKFDGYVKIDNTNGAEGASALSILQASGGSAIEIYGGPTQTRFGINMPTVLTTSLSSIPYDFGFAQDPVSGDSYLAYMDGSYNVKLVQNAGVTQYFSDPTEAAFDSITFDEANNIYNFNADGGSRNAYIQSYHIAIGTASASASIMANMINSISVNSTRYGIYNDLTITAATLTADRSLRGVYNSLTLNYQNAAAFSPNAYACYNIAATGTSNGNSLDGEGQLYGCYNYALHQSDDATYKRIEEAHGSFNYVYSSGDTSLIDNAFGVYGYVRTGGTSASASVAVTNAYAIYGYVNAGSVNRNITNAYLLYLNSAETGTVTTKWGVYVNSTWPNFFNGNVILDGAVHYTPTVVTPVAAGTTTLTTSTSIVMCNHTATIASHTFAFPSTGLTNGQQITISSRSIITAVTLSGGTFRSAITTLAAGGFAQYTYSSTGAAWFRTA
jgi:hypothetical protein